MTRNLKSLIANNVTLGSPYWLREIVGNFCLSYLYLSNINYIRFRKFLAASQYFPPWKLEQYQTERLKVLLSYAYKNVPYYTDIFIKNNLTPDSFNSIKDLKKLPLLTKEDIFKNHDKLISRKIEKKYLFPIRTSGSTGTPIQLYRDSRFEYINTAFIRRAFASLGMTIYHRGVHIWLLPFVLNHISDTHIYSPHMKHLELATLHKGLPLWEEKSELIKRFRPSYIFAPPSVLYDFACYLQEHRIDDMAVRYIISCSENLFPYQRELIQKQFRCKAYNYYACEENAVSAIECLQQNGLHLDMEKGITEIVDEKGELLSDDKSGRIIVTPLHIFAMPLIRYDTGDVGSISTDPCSCGRGLSLLKSFDGRISEAIRYKDKIIYPSALSGIIYQFKNIRECQFIQEKATEVIINIVRRDGFSENAVKEIVKYLHNLMDEGLEIKLNFVDRIPRTRMGKFQFVISRYQ